MSLFMIFANVANRLEKLQWDFFGGGGGCGGEDGEWKSNEAQMSHGVGLRKRD